MGPLRVPAEDPLGEVQHGPMQRFPRADRNRDTRRRRALGRSGGEIKAADTVAPSF